VMGCVRRGWTSLRPGLQLGAICSCQPPSRTLLQPPGKRPFCQHRVVLVLPVGSVPAQVSLYNRQAGWQSASHPQQCRADVVMDALVFSLHCALREMQMQQPQPGVLPAGRGTVLLLRGVLDGYRGGDYVGSVSLFVYYCGM